MRIERALVCSVLALGLHGAGARADSPAAKPIADPEARRLYEDAHRLHRAGEYARAIDELERAYALSGAPAILFDLGQTARLAGDCGRAVAYYRRFLSTEPAAPARARATALVEALGSCAAQPSRPAGAPNAPPVEAGAGAPTARAPSSLTPTPPAAAPPALLVATPDTDDAGAPAPHATGRRRLAWGCAIGGGALLAASGYFGIRAAASADDVSAAFKPGMTWSAANAHAETVGVRNERLEIGAAIAGAVAVTAAAWLFATSRERRGLAHASR